MLLCQVETLTKKIGLIFGQPHGSIYLFKVKESNASNVVHYSVSLLTFFLHSNKM